MAVKVSVPYRRTFEVPLELQAAFDYFANVAEAVPANFPGVEEFQPIGVDSYRWVFEKVGYSSYEIIIKLATRFTKESPNRITVHPIPEVGAFLFTGAWEFAAKGAKTEVTFSANLEMDLPIPFFLKAVAVPLAQKELTNLFDRYIHRVEKNLAK